jgi:hypothetical protein
MIAEHRISAALMLEAATIADHLRVADAGS